MAPSSLRTSTLQSDLIVWRSSAGGAIAKRIAGNAWRHLGYALRLRWRPEAFRARSACYSDAKSAQSRPMPRGGEANPMDLWARESGRKRLAAAFLLLAFG